MIDPEDPHKGKSYYLSGIIVIASAISIIGWFLIHGFIFLFR